jgi:hypothetical protein
MFSVVPTAVLAVTFEIVSLAQLLPPCRMLTNNTWVYYNVRNVT